MKKRKQWLAAFLAMIMAVQTVTVAMPAEVRAEENAADELLFHDFETETIESNTSGTLTTEEKHGGDKALRYERNNNQNYWNVEVESKAGGTVDISDYKYIAFWIKGSTTNAIEVKFIDSNNKETKVRTSMTPTKDEWSYMTVPLSSFSFSGDNVDKTAIKKVAFWDDPDNVIFYIDDIVFLKDIQADESSPLSGTPALLQNFEGSDVTNMYEAAAEEAVVSIEEGIGYNGSKGVKYQRTTNSAAPSKDKGSVVLKSDTSVDITGLRYLVFYIKDTQGSNNPMISLIDSDGKESNFSWTNDKYLKSTKNTWTQFHVPLSSISTDGIDITKVTGIRIGEWNQGTYYIDNIYFENYLFTGVPGSEDYSVPEVAANEVEASVDGGYYYESMNVELFANLGEFIYYTADGTEPTRTASCQYTGAIKVSQSTIIKAFAATPNGARGETKTFEYKICPYPVTATSAPGSYDDQAVVEFRTKSDKDLIYYTTDDSEPDRDTNKDNTVQFIKPMLVTESTTFKAVAYDPDTGEKNQATTLTYIINKTGKVTAPIVSKPEGTYGTDISVALSAEEGSTIYYTTDGTNPTKESTEYTKEITINKDMMVKAIAVREEKGSDIAEYEYTLKREETPFLKADGKVLKDNFGTGDTITLRGTNAGGWLVTEDWQCPTNAKDQLTAQNVFSERFDAETAQNLIDLYQDGWWSEDDFDLVKEEGMNVLRLPITYFEMLKADGTLKETAFDRMQWFIENCEKRGLYVLIDMHGAVGSQNGKDHSGDITIPDVGDFYGNEENIQKTIKLWEAIAEKYKDNPWVCGYDLLNEPSAVGTPQFEVYDRIYDAIRAIDKNHVIYIQSIWEPTHLPDPSFYGWQNVVYQYHFYGWNVETDAEGQKAFIESKVKMVNEDTGYDVPLLVGEFTFFSNSDSWKAMDIFEEQGWSYTSWTWKVTGKNSSWGMYTSNHAKVDIYNDSEETIREKWAADKLKTTSSAFTRNDQIADILKGYYANNDKNKPGTTAAEGIAVAVADVVSVEPGKTVNLNAKVIPENTAYQALSYATSNAAVADVDEKGVVTAKTAGTAVITVTNLYGMEKNCTVIVDMGPTICPPAPPAKVTGLKQTKEAAKSLTVSWSAVKGADGYEVTFIDGSKETTKETTATSISYSSLKAGSVYKVSVSAFYKDGKVKRYGQETTLTVKTLLAKKPSSFKAKKSGTKAKLTWKKVAGVTGYEIYMKTGNGSFKKIKTLKGASKKSYTKSKLSKGKTYSFKIRAYKKVGSTNVYSSFTSAKKVKIK